MVTEYIQSPAIPMPARIAAGMDTSQIPSRGIIQNIMKITMIKKLLFTTAQINPAKISQFQIKLRAAPAG